MTPFIVIATPYMSNVVYDFHASLLQVSAELLGMGVQCAQLVQPGNNYVHDARNHLLSRFLEIPQATHLLWWDSDVGVQKPTQAVLEFLQREEEIVAGCPPLKQERTEFPVKLVRDTETGKLVERDGYLQTALAPTGFMCMKRSSVEKLAAGARSYWAPLPDGGETENYWVFEACLGQDIDGRVSFWTEDAVMCDKWIGIGGEIWIDPKLKFTHTGTKKYDACLQDHLQRLLEIHNLRSDATPCPTTLTPSA